jgi:hypothetical protein
MKKIIAFALLFAGYTYLICVNSEREKTPSYSPLEISNQKPMIKAICATDSVTDGNDSPTSATLLDINNMTNNTYQINPLGDVDWYAINIPMDGSFRIYSTRPSGSLDAMVSVYGPYNNASGNEITASSNCFTDDSEGGVFGLWLNSVDAGWYFIKVSASDEFPNMVYHTGSYQLFIITNHISPLTYEVPYTFTQRSIIVGSMGDWTASSDVSWLSISNSSGTGSAYVNFTCNSFTDIYPRIGTVTFAFSNGYPQDCSCVVTQTGTTIDYNESPATATYFPYLPISSVNYAINPVGDIDWYKFYIHNTGPLHIWTNTNTYSIHTRAYLYGPYPDSTGTGVFTDDYVAYDNDSGENDQPDISYTVSQTGWYYLRINYFGSGPSTGVYYLNIAPTHDNYLNHSYSIVGIENNTCSFEISGWSSWTIETDDDWLTLSQISGFGDATVNVNVDENTTGSSRIGTININFTNNSPSTLSYYIYQTEIGFDDNYEPYNATELNLPVDGFQNEIFPVNDVDWFEFNVPEIGPLTIYTTTIADSLDLQAFLYGPYSNPHSIYHEPNSFTAYDNDSNGNSQPLLNYSVIQPGYYLLKINQYSANYNQNNEMTNTRDIRSNWGPYQLFIHTTFQGNSVNPISFIADYWEHTYQITVATSGNWNLTGISDWITCSTTSGFGNSIITIDIPSNFSGIPRTCNLIVEFEDGSPDEMSCNVQQQCFVHNNDPGNAPAVTLLNGNYPNPFTGCTTINYSIKSSSRVKLCVYNIKGQLIRRLIDKKVDTGKYAIMWDGKSDDGKTASNGVYFVTMNADTYHSSRKIIILK